LGQIAQGQVDPNATPQAQAAAGVRQQLAAGTAQLAHLIGGNEQDFLRNLGLLSYGQQNTAQTAAQNQICNAQKGVTDILGQQGAFKQTDAQSVLGNEAKAQQQQFANANTAALTQAALGKDAVGNQVAQQNADTNSTNATTKATNVKLTATQKAAALKEKRHEAAAKTHPGTDVSEGAWSLWGTQGKAGAAKRQKALVDHQKLTHPVKPVKPGTTKPPRYGPGSLTQDQENKSYGTLDSAIRTANRFISGGKSAGQPIGQGTIRQELLNGINQKNSKGQLIKTPSFETWVVNAAMDIVYNGFLSAPNVRALHSHGLQVHGHYPTTPKGKGTHWWDVKK
jgi:hypothetical protein